jgi:hypothetical protein
MVSSGIAVGRSGRRSVNLKDPQQHAGEERSDRLELGQRLR